MGRGEGVEWVLGLKSDKEVPGIFCELENHDFCYSLCLTFCQCCMGLSMIPASVLRGNGCFNTKTFIFHLG